jgi:dTDP-4-dehydrorhamnose 3,5-epimerase
LKSSKLEIPEVVLFEPRVFSDDRGAFFESFNSNAFRDATGLDIEFFQDNHSVSAKNVVRGLHYQLAPMAQGKLVRCVAGAVFDVAVDIRKSSPTFGKWVGEVLSADNRKQLWIPAGFAHGFMALSDNSEFLYKTTAPYSAEYERCILWSDPTIAISWPDSGNVRTSQKDADGLPWARADFFD